MISIAIAARKLLLSILHSFTASPSFCTLLLILVLS
jgi:hypothetical protein